MEYKHFSDSAIKLLEICWPLQWRTALEDPHGCQDQKRWLLLTAWNQPGSSQFFPWTQLVKHASYSLSILKYKSDCWRAHHRTRSALSWLFALLIPIAHFAIPSIPLLACSQANILNSTPFPSWFRELLLRSLFTGPCSWWFVSISQPSPSMWPPLPTDLTGTLP